ncbi:MAG: hypothetical protein KC464_13730, partial [Myxococcales bacterium]|nr:hypothetical protein [Myxococcales bacterium]
MRILPFLAAALGVCAVPAIARAAPCDTSGPDLVVSGITCQLSGVHTFGTVQVIDGGRIEVVPYAGGDPSLTGNLELRAHAITIDATSAITARGVGYQTPLCGDGVQPGAVAAGGCSVRDSGGGGSHFGGGGRGTKDCPGGGCSFPRDWEEDCGNSLNGGGTACSDVSNCRNNDALPTTASASYYHSIYEPEFGGSGGDKGCRDGDGFSRNVAGAGGGRIVLAALDGGAGTISIAGTVDADGKRGCGWENDSGGGGAGGTVLIVGETVTVTSTARITAAGGLGGDTRGSLDPTGDCASAQQGSTCDDCGGGGGGGIISVLSVVANIQDPAVFSVAGALGGTCAICQGEAGGGAGELQLAGAYVGELCDGYDNDFDDSVDEGFGTLTCPGGPVPACLNGVPQICPADVPACVGPVTDTRARFVVIVDTSGSMLTDLTGTPTFGDGSVDHPGLDQDGDGAADDSRLFLAKRALSTVIAAYPDIDFALARYHQDEAVDRSCQLSHWFECADICCTYDDPTNNIAPAPVPACTVDGGSAGPLAVLTTSPGDECINYAGNCGPPRRGADVLVDFGADINEYLMWLDGTETNFQPDATPGAYCAFGLGGDCELRGTGPTPLDNSLRAVHDYLEPILPCDAASTGGCRKYGVILLTDGAESCNGDPVDAAGDLKTALGVETYVVGFSVLPAEAAELDAIAAAGSFSGTRPAFLVGDEDQLANALASIVSDSVVFETCNGLDDDCDGRVDEDFPALGGACNDGELGACLGTGTFVCNGAGDGVTCDLTDPGANPDLEVCNGDDDDCDGLIDEGLNCQTPCVPTGRDLCNGLDDDCNGAVDDDDPDVGTACGQSDDGVCELGTFVCIAGDLVCVGAVYPDPTGESCDGQDDDCDLIVDEDAPCPGDTACVDGGCRLPCGGGEFECPLGFDCVEAAGGRYCVPGPCAACLPGEICIADACVDPCAGVTCGPGEECRLGDCLDCSSLGCPAGQVCYGSACEPDPCDGVDCGGAAGCDGDLGCSCVGGDCVPNCDDTLCPSGQRCGPAGACEDDACDGVVCPGAQVCRDGACEDDPCDGRSCGPGDVCVAGTCVDDPCPRATCSRGRHCEVTPAGDPVCVADEPRPPPDRM